MSTFVESQEMTSVNCCKCGVLFAMPSTWNAHFRTTHNNFYCPAGHPQHYPGETEFEKLQKEVARLQTTIEHKEAEIVSVRGQRDHLDRSRNAIRGVLTRTCKRIKAGVCPCCDRAFSNLADHMTTKHPRYQDGNEEPK